uniref:Uncharacterized protein LOC100370628 n=1 Tax=Saccoglossus kowalevskii TaxID=10224 RepID=A0ABM0MVE3_SACKO|nr:PREDICTED: uncharacterized protein LOC100370628 [Saccoglossus kowalevskii]
MDIHVFCARKNAELVDEASSGNSGMAHTGFDAHQFRELQLLKAARKLNTNVYRKYEVPHKMTGAVLVAWNQDELAKLPGIVRQSHLVGVTDVRQISQKALREMEPHLSHDALGAVIIPGETVVDPWLLPIRLAHDALQHGAQIFRNCKVTDGYQTTTNDWLLTTTRGQLLGKAVINCAGLYGDEVEKINKESSFQIMPRKGQFAIFERSPKELLNGMILPVPFNQSYKGIIVFPTVYGNIVVGPTAEDQESRIDRSTDKETIDQLVNYARKTVPALRNKNVIGTYAGIRPATQAKDYHLITHKNRSWITVGGIRSTGVSACLAIAVHVKDEVIDKLKIQPSNNSPHSRSKVAGQQRSSIRVDPKGHLLMDGYSYKITHPLSRAGLLAKPKL